MQGFPFFAKLRNRKARRHKCGAYCRTNWRCTAVLFRQAVGVGVSETLPIFQKFRISLLGDGTLIPESACATVSWVPRKGGVASRGVLRP